MMPDSIFTLCPGCGKAYGRKGIAPHVYRPKDRPCLPAYRRHERDGTLIMFSVPSVGAGSTWKLAQKIVKERGLGYED